MLKKKDVVDEADLKRTYQEVVKDMQTTSEKAVSTLQKLSQTVDAKNLFVSVFASMILAPADQIDEMTYGDIPAKLELLAYHLFPFFRVSHEEITPWKINECIEALDILFIRRIQQDMFPTEGEKPSSPIDAIINLLQMQAKVVRGSAYPEQTSEEIMSIQGKFERLFERKLGIGPCRACALVWTIVQRMEEKANEYLPDLINHGKLFETRYREAKGRRSKKCASAEDRKLLKIFKDRKSAWSFGFVNLECHLAPIKLPVSFKDLALPTSTPAKKGWDALLDLIGLTQKICKRMTDPIEVREKPLFVLPGKKVLLADVSNTLDVLWDRFESTAKTEQNFYDRYQHRKAKWLEEKIRNSLFSIFPSSNIYENLSYPDPDRGGGSTAELDFAVHWGPFMVLIEAKAKQFRLASQLGDIGRLRTDIKENVEDAFEQARRAQRYIESAEAPEFKEIKGDKTLTFSRHDIRRTYLLTISQHHLAGLVNHFKDVTELGLFKDGEYPLSICAADFEIIAEFCSGPDIFLHYIERRLSIPKMSVRFEADELDFFGAYLDTRLKPEKLWGANKKPDWIHFSGWSSKFDQWMAFKRGKITNAPQITLKVPDEINEILFELRRRMDDYGARWIAFALLDLPENGLEAIAKIIQEIRAVILTPGMLRRITHQEGDTVISIVASLDLSLNDLEHGTLFRTAIEKYRRRTTKSIGIGIMVTDQARPFHCAAWEEGPWQYESEMEKLLAEEPPFMPAPGQKLPCRNEPCICGSGKKFKKCCLPKIEATRKK